MGLFVSTLPTLHPHNGPGCLKSRQTESTGCEWTGRRALAASLGRPAHILEQGTQPYRRYTTYTQHTKHSWQTKEPKKMGLLFFVNILFLVTWISPEPRVLRSLILLLEECQTERNTVACKRITADSDDYLRTWLSDASAKTYTAAATTSSYFWSDEETDFCL